MDGKIQVDDVKEKIIGITGDGAFAKSHKPFKNKINELFGKETQIRWDLLHLINCAHKEVRGKTKHEESEENYETVETESCDHDQDLFEPDSIKSHEDTLNDKEITVAVVEDIRVLIEYIQNTAKKFRTGIMFTVLRHHPCSFRVYLKNVETVVEKLYQENKLNRFTISPGDT